MFASSVWSVPAAIEGASQLPAFPRHHGWRRCRPRTAIGGTVASADERLGQAVLMRRCHSRLPAPRSSFAGFRFPPEVITVAVRWYFALWAVVPRRRRAASRARDRGRSCECLPVGAAVYSAADRRGSALSACARRSVV